MEGPKLLPVDTMGDHTLAVEIPADDGAIQQAFAVLDAQLEAWKAAMHRAQRTLVERPARVAALASETPAAVQHASVRSVDTTSIAPEDGASRIDITVDETSAAEAGRSGSVGGERETQVPASVAEVADASVAEVTEPIGVAAKTPDRVDVELPEAAEEAAVLGTDEVAPAAGVVEPLAAACTEEAPAAVPSQVEDDEALLASLDEGTAKAIRVMRRLSDTRKSVRQLLAEYETSKSHQAKDQPTKRSWWKRGK